MHISPSAAAGVMTRLALRVVARRPPDFVVGATSPGGAYLRRWWLVRRNRWANAYLHHFLRDDDDRALHDHPWPSISLVVRGAYTEHTIARGGLHRRRVYGAGSVLVRRPGFAHRIELHDGPCWTLFLTGPRVREWGFHCANQGWVPWQRFTQSDNPGETGKGCEG